MEAYSITKHTCSGHHEMLPAVYLDEAVAKMWCKDNGEEFTHYATSKVWLRDILPVEKVIDKLNRVVVVVNDTKADYVAERARKKLTPEERKALGIA